MPALSAIDQLCHVCALGLRLCCPKSHLTCCLSMQLTPDSRPWYPLCFLFSFQYLTPPTCLWSEAELSRSSVPLVGDVRSDTHVISLPGWEHLGTFTLLLSSNRDILLAVIWALMLQEGNQPQWAQNQSNSDFWKLLYVAMPQDPTFLHVYTWNKSSHLLSMILNK